VNGRAATTIDGKAETYWHSAWQVGTASFPHHIAVKMNKFELVTGFLFKLSGGTTRHMKSIELWGSTDGTSYSLMRQTTVPDAEDVYVSLDKPWLISKFKLVIKTSQTGEVHCRINEMDATIQPVTNTGIKNPVSVAYNAFVDPVSSKLTIQFAANEQKLTVRVFDLNGKMLYSEVFNQIVANQQVQTRFSIHANELSRFIVSVNTARSVSHNQLI